MSSPTYPGKDIRALSCDELAEWLIANNVKPEACEELKGQENHVIVC